MKYLPQPMSEKESSDTEMLARKSHERIKSFLKKRNNAGSRNTIKSIEPEMRVF